MVVGFQVLPVRIASVPVPAYETEAIPVAVLNAEMKGKGMSIAVSAKSRHCEITDEKA